MDGAIVGALAGVLGSLIGGAATFGTAWVTQKSLSTRELVAADIRNREALYAEFIRECSKVSIDSFSHTLETLETILPVYALRAKAPSSPSSVSRMSARHSSRSAQAINRSIRILSRALDVAVFMGAVRRLRLTLRLARAVRKPSKWK